MSSEHVKNFFGGFLKPDRNISLYCVYNAITNIVNMIAVRNEI